MPETDWLTDLSSRPAFARQVRQADRDRDQFAVAIVGIRRIEEINRRLGFDAGDELLRTVGKGLSCHTAVGTTIARLGGAQFGVMTVGSAAEDMRNWCEPVASAVNSALMEWTYEQIDFNGECPIRPELVMGAAGGFSGRVWADAGLALDQAEANAEHNPGQSRLVIHDPSDTRLAGRRQQADLNAGVDRSLDEGTMAAMLQEVDVIGRSNMDRRWGRLVAQAPLADHRSTAEATAVPTSPRPVDIAALSPDVGRRVEHWLTEKAAAMISSHVGQLRVTVPVAWEVDTGPAFSERLAPLLERLMVPSSRLLIEVDEDALSRAGARGLAFVESMASLGSGLVLAGCDGGYRSVEAATGPGIRYLKPAPALTTAAANADRGAQQVLLALSHVVAEHGQELIGPIRSGEDRCLHELGFTYVERPATTNAHSQGSDRPN